MNLITILVLNFIIISTIFPQEFISERKIDYRFAKEKYNWYDSTTSTFQTKYPRLKFLPPINNNMSPEIKNLYLRLDSLLKVNTLELEFELEIWNGNNDLLELLIGYYYKIIDYNPVIFRQYAYSINNIPKPKSNYVMLRKKNLSTGNYIDSILKIDTNLNTSFYNRDLFSLEDKLVNHYNDNIPRNNLWAVLSLLNSDYILRVRILDIDSLEAKNSVASDMVYGVHAEVIDTLKGRYFKNECENHKLDNEVNNELDRNSMNPCIKFMYKKEIYDPEFKRVDWINDPEFETGYKSFGLKKGQEAIVFLKFSMRHIDNEFDYLRLLVYKFASNGALPIIGGKVRDLNHFWSKNDMIEYKDWLDIFSKHKNKLVE